MCVCVFIHHCCCVSYSLSRLSTRQHRYILDDHPFSDFEIPKFHLWAFKDVAIGSASMLFGQFMLASNQDSQTFEGNKSDRNLVWILRGSLCGTYVVF